MKTSAVTAGISTLGVLFMLAGVFDIIRWNIALYLGIACFVIVGVLPSVLGKGDEQ